MSRIQWEPLAIPDIGESAIRAQAMAGQTIRNAFQDFTGVLNQWEGAQRDREMAELIARQESFVGKDNALYDAARANGSLTRGFNYIRPEQLAQSVRAFGTDLERDYRGDLAFADGRTDRQFMLDERQRGITERESGLAIQRQLYALEGQLATGAIDRAKYNELAAPLLAQAATAGQVESIRDARQRGVGEYRTGVQFDRGTYTWERGLRDDRQKDRAAVILNELSRDNIDGVGALTALNSDRYKNEDPEVLNAIREAIPTMFSTLDAITAPEGGMPSGASYAGGEASGDVYNTILGHGQFGQPPRPITEMSIGEVIQFGRNVLIPITRNNRQLGLAGTGKGSSAVGAYQFTQETLADFAPRVLGANWASMPLSGENQEKIAQAIFRDTRGRPAALRARWQGLQNMSDAQLRALGQMPWEQARQEIARVEVGGRIPERTSAAAVRNSRMNLDAGLAVGADAGGGGNQTALAVGYLAAAQRPGASVQAITNELISGRPAAEGQAEEPGIFKGVSEGVVRRAVRALTDDAELGVSPAVAAWALAETAQRGSNPVQRFIFRDSALNNEPNVAAARALILRTKNTDMRGQIEVVAQNRESAATLAAAEAAEAAAHARLAQAQARQRAAGGRADISRYVADAEAATARTAAARAAAADPTVSQVRTGQAAAGVPARTPVARGPAYSAPPPRRRSRFDDDEAYRRRVFGES